VRLTRPNFFPTIFPVAENLFCVMSRAELKKEIDHKVEQDNRSLPEKAKIFAAVASLQRFDQLPDAVSSADLETLIADGCVELNRGISSNKGVPASLYARDLLSGPLYPGTQVAIGQGIYFATPSLEFKDDGFPRISSIARRFAEQERPGVIVRCALKKTAPRIRLDNLSELWTEFRSRARVAGILDPGTVAAALGYSAYYRDDFVPTLGEEVWVVVNRTDLVFQEKALQIGEKPIDSSKDI
jgi:hypothetical protein